MDSMSAFYRMRKSSRSSGAWRMGTLTEATKAQADLWASLKSGKGEAMSDQKLREALQGLIQAVEMEQHEKGVSGFMGARLHDAREALLSQPTSDEGSTAGGEGVPWRRSVLPRPYSPWRRFRRIYPSNPRGDGGEALNTVMEQLKSIKWDCENCDWHCEDCGHDYQMMDTDIYNSVRSAITALNKFTATPPAATDGFVRVPKEQIEKVERCRRVLNELTDALRVHNFPIWSAQIQSVTADLWNVTHRKYAATPQSGKKEDGWLPIKRHERILPCPSNIVYEQRLDDAQWFQYTLPPLPAPSSPQAEGET